MKLNSIKTLIPAVALALSMGFVSCTKDLDVDNINPQQTSKLDTDALLNKIYSSFVLTGQKGPGDNDAAWKDIQDLDEGRSEFFRMSWELNEFTSDEASWVWWSDGGLRDLVTNTYAEGNERCTGFYYRAYFTITLCNFYLDQVADDGTTDVKQKRAEVRFIRALVYWYIMDLFGNAAFIEHVSAIPGIRYTRAQYFDYIEKELTEIEADMGDPGTLSYGRVDKVANWLLKARLYLNAEVYTGTARWADAKTYAEKAINNGYYHLHTTGKNGFSAYQMLFLADNDENGAQYEAVFPILHDGINTTSHGAMNMLVLSSYSGAMSNDIPSGTDNGWGRCNRVKGTLTDRFFGSTEVPQTGDLAQIIKLAGDDRALIYPNAPYSRYITSLDDQEVGYGCVKFRNVRSDGAAAKAQAKVDTDLPLMRLAEAYLTYAEAETRLNGNTSDAANKINEIRSRANASTKTSYTLDDIFNEWSKEFWFEGRRRVDMVRFGRFGGQSSYKWEWMNNTFEGSQFPAYRNIFPIPVNDLENNPNLRQNDGYRNN
jgi:hypothetical protein